MRPSIYWNISAKVPVGLNGAADGVYTGLGVATSEGVGVMKEGEELVRVGVAAMLDGVGLGFGLGEGDSDIVGEDTGDA